MVRKFIGLVALIVVATTMAHSQPRREEAQPYSEGDRARDLVVWLSDGIGQGSGVIFHLEGTRISILTAKHVVSQTDRLQLLLRPWQWKELTATVEYTHDALDLAILSADLSPLQVGAETLARVLPLELLGDPSTISRGDKVVPVGHSADEFWLSPERSPVFSSFEQVDRKLWPKRDVMRFEFSCPQGFSGGALFDENWRLVGMNYRANTVLCEALRIDSVLAVIKKDWQKAISLRRIEVKPRPPQAIRPLRVAVVNFDNRSGRNMPEIGAMAQDVITSSLFSIPKLEVLNRDRISALEREIYRQGTVMNTEAWTRLGKLHDVDAVVTGSVIRYDVERREFDGYGTSAMMDLYTLGISLMVIDVETARVRFSKDFTATDRRSYPKAASAPYEPMNLVSPLLQNALQEARPELQKGLMQVAAGLPSAADMLEVEIVSIPEGAEVLVGGIYRGSTPVTLELQVGVHELQVEHRDYRPWRRQVHVTPGMMPITARLTSARGGTETR